MNEKLKVMLECMKWRQVKKEKAGENHDQAQNSKLAAAQVAYVVYDNHAVNSSGTRVVAAEPGIGRPGPAPTLPPSHVQAARDASDEGIEEEAGGSGVHQVDAAVQRGRKPHNHAHAHHQSGIVAVNGDLRGSGVVV